MENDLRSSMIIDDHSNQQYSTQTPESHSSKIRTPNEEVKDEISLLSEEFNNIFKDTFKEIENGNFQIPFNDPNGLFLIPHTHYF